MFSLSLRLFRHSVETFGYDYLLFQVFLFKLHAGLRIYKDATGYSDFIHIDAVWNGKFYRILHTELLD